MTPTSGHIIDGRYRLGALLGRGGMGTVFAARDEERNLDCAIKILRPEVARPDQLTRFKREFRAASRLSHPNCVRVFDLGQDGDVWYFTMEHVDGRSLDPNSVTSVEDVVSIGLQVLATLDHIHARRIIHRDIKPENILLDRSTPGAVVVKLSDFGIAQMTDVSDLVGLGRIVGSLKYMSPEQARGEQVDPRSDLYSVGVVLYQLLARRLPFEPTRGRDGRGGGGSGGASDWLSLHINAEPRPLDPAEAPAPLAEVILKLLAKDPADRFSTAAGVYDRLLAWMQTHASELARPRHPPLLRGAFLAAPAFVGRSVEFARAERFLQDALLRSGPAPRLLTSSGDAGVGKSRLANRIMLRCEADGVKMYTATCRAEPGVPHEPLLGLLRRLGDRILAPPEPNAISTTLGATPAPPAGVYERASERWAFYRRVADALIASGREDRWLIMLEDAQWADAATLELIGFCVRGVTHAARAGAAVRVAFVLTHRPSPKTHAMSTLLKMSDDLATRVALPLAPLTFDAAVEMVASMLMLDRDNPGLLRFVQRLSDNASRNPLYLIQTLHTLHAADHLMWTGDAWNLDSALLAGAHLPATIHDAIGDQAAHFSVDTRRALAYGAVIGRRFDLATLRAVTVLDSAALLDCLDEAIRAGFIHEDAPDSFAFVHNRFREAIYARLPDDERRHSHRRVALELELLAADSRDAAADLAHHFEACGQPESAFRHSVRAADHAAEALAFSQAADLFEQAIRLAGEANIDLDPELFERCGDACLQAGRHKLASDSFERRLSSVQAPLRRAELLAKIAEVLWRGGFGEQATARFEDVLEHLGFVPPKTRRALYFGLLRNALCAAWCAVFSPRRVKTPAVGPERETARMLSRVAEAYYFSDFTRTAYFQLAALRHAERIGPSSELAIALGQTGAVLTSLGLSKIGFRYLDRARDVAESDGTRAARAWQSLLRGMSYAAIGDAPAHDAALAKSAETFRQSEEPMRLPQAWIIHAEAHLVMGNNEAAEHLAQKITQLAEEIADDKGRGWGAYTSGLVASRRSQHELAELLFRDAIEHCRIGGDVTYRLTSAARLVQTLVLMGRDAEAAELGERTAKERLDRGIRHLSLVSDGAFMSAAAAAARHSKAARKRLSTSVDMVRSKGHSHSSGLRYTRPSFLAGQAAWDSLRDPKLGAKRFDRAAEVARDLGLQGELLDVHRFAIEFLDAPLNDQHRWGIEALTTGPGRGD